MSSWLDLTDFKMLRSERSVEAIVVLAWLRKEWALLNEIISLVATEQSRFAGLL